MEVDAKHLAELVWLLVMYIFVAYLNAIDYQNDLFCGMSLELIVETNPYLYG